MQNALKALLADYDITLRTVSRDTGLDYSCLYQWCKNRRSIPYVPLLRLAAYLEVPPVRIVPSLGAFITEAEVDALVQDLKVKTPQKPRRTREHLGRKAR